MAMVNVLQALTVILLKELHGLEVNITSNMTKVLGDINTKIECSYNFENVDSINLITMDIYVNNDFLPVVRFNPITGTSLSSDGQYLSNRVTYYNITQDSRKVELFFIQLTCVDDKEYRCHIRYTPRSGSEYDAYSPTTKITVQGTPAKPNSIDFSHDNSAEDGANMTKNDCFVEINSKLVNCSEVLVTCSGPVGDPPENLTAQMIEDDTIVANLTTKLNSSTSAFRENCSYIRTSSFATNLTRTQNTNIKFRCAPTSLINSMYLETIMVQFLYPVQTPSIVTLPENATYLPVTLHCTADGNPLPKYTWYRNDIVLIRNQQNVSASESGVYKCVVNNTFGQQEAEANITLQERTTTTTTAITTEVDTTITSSAPANPNTTPSADESKTDAKKLIPIIGGVVGGVVFIIIVAVIIIKCRHSSKPENIQRRDDDLKMSSRKGVDNYYSMTLDEDNGKQRDSAEVQNQKEETRKHNERYLKQQELESNNRQGDSQPVEYAAVNKPKKGRPYQNTDVHQPAEYAQVNKMRGNSNEPAPDYDDDPYASGKGIYDHAHDRRHKKTEDLESYDTAATVMNRKSGKNKTNLGSVPDTTAEALKQRQERQSRAITQVDDNLKENIEPKTSL